MMNRLTTIRRGDPMTSADKCSVICCVAMSVAIAASIWAYVWFERETFRIAAESGLQQEVVGMQKVWTKR